MHHLLIFSIFILQFSPVLVHSISFTYPKFEPNTKGIFYQGDSFPAPDALQITKNQRDKSLSQSVGRASYYKPIRLWNATTGLLTDFTTQFSFIIKAVNPNISGDGLAFFIAPSQVKIPENSTGGYLGLFSKNSALTPDVNQMVAVEFDTYQNSWDPSPDHVGINVNSIVSVANVSWQGSMKSGALGNAWISYNSTTHNLTVFVTYTKKPVFKGDWTLSYVVDLRKVLPEWVTVGFSAATGKWIEIHNIVSWSFNSTLEDDIIEEENDKKGIALVVGPSIGAGVLTCGLGFVWFIWWRKRRDGKPGGMVNDGHDFERETGPRKFTFRELRKCTNNFSEDGKLGEGGFGGVYRGLLSDSNEEIAVKRISKGSKQGIKEYVSEVKIISQLRHRNLVQLVGWCHDQAELLLVYEFMPNGSLDRSLFEGIPMLTWKARYKIAQGLASALLYLHEEWEQCVVHRDIKSSNVMLDSNFNAKLGDFGLARLVDHELGSQTTVLAGTMGYLAPECVTTGRASKESDVYSFGMVLLEIACGRRPVQLKAEPSKVRLVEWVWDLYGKHKVLDAADKTLDNVYDEKQMEALMVVGLWCCHPDHTYRPSIMQAISALKFEISLPSLPSKLPMPMYYAPPMNMCKFTYTSPALTIDRAQCSISSSGSSAPAMDRTQCSTSSYGSSAGSTRSLLQVQKDGM
ncbi:L-type lectin-domain containing receptor kinase IX.1-like [Impatiens glandulifera]|uniref:L-type lectin-domain containing receptor kinase IX.1-like n=1 Tax=Impatiens glandulifera TaxID=253017 RepID=UPI001FB0F0F9|nr:L-type lectin-domain containing receptor kinase IX.1-like [Impatiens glandulifera]